MVWFQVDDGFYSHPKVLEIPRDVRPLAIGVWTLAGTWCSQKLTDGKISQSMALEIGCSQDGIEALLRVKLWRRLKGNRYEFVNWPEFQQTRDQVEEKRARERERKYKARHAPAPDASDSPEVSARTNVGVQLPYPIQSTDDDVRDLTPRPKSHSGARQDDSQGYAQVVESVVAALAEGGLTIHPIVVPDIVAFIDRRRGPRAQEVKVPARYYPGAIRSSWAEVQQFIHEKGLAS